MSVHSPWGASRSGPVLGSSLALGGVLGLCPPTRQLHTGSIEAGTFLAACVTWGEGAGPAPTDPEGLAAPGGGPGRLPAHLEVTTPFLLPRGRQMFPPGPGPRLGDGAQRLWRRPPRDKGSPRTGGAPHTAGSRGSRQRRPEESGAAASSRRHTGRAGPSRRAEWGPPAGGRGLDVLIRDWSWSPDGEVGRVQAANAPRTPLPHTHHPGPRQATFSPVWPDLGAPTPPLPPVPLGLPPGGRLPR